MSDHPDLDLEAVKADLLERLAELDRLSEQSRQARAPVTLEQQSVGRLSRMDALQGQAMALAVQRRRETARTRILQALKRLEEGEFGYCVRCGEPIQLERLRLDPTIPTCIRCAA